MLKRDRVLDRMRLLRSSHGRQAGRFATVVALACAMLLALAGAAGAQVTTYTSTQTIPIPPAANYQGSAGGDGWGLELTNTDLYNVFHHDNQLQFACHVQATASTCYPSSPETITPTSAGTGFGIGDTFGTSATPGLYLDQSDGHLFVWATDENTETAGVVCIDTTSSSTDPFCGFTALSAVGEASDDNGISSVTDPMLVGNDWYAVNYVAYAGESASQNELMCFDVATDAACQGQPFSVNYGFKHADDYTDGQYEPGPPTVAIGGELLLPVWFYDPESDSAYDTLACFNPSTQTNCGGNFPLFNPTPDNWDFVQNSGPAFPLLSSTGTVQGFCLPTDTDPCFDLAGNSVATPANMPSAIYPNDPWNGGAFVLGPRIYIPNHRNSVVYCYDYSTDASCSGYPLQLDNMEYLYTLNPDPQRPTCIWANSDNGAWEIQNFDAYTGGACGQGAIRVLASQFIVPQAACYPTSYVSLQVLQPAPSTYTSGTITFEDSDGNPLTGIGTLTLDNTGTVSLAGLDLDQNGLPQFLIQLNGETGTPGNVVVQLTWTADYDASCIGPGTTTAQSPTTTITSLSGGGQNGATISVSSGTSVTDQATLAGTNASTATGTVTYNVYSDPNCTDPVDLGTAETITTPGTAPPSAGVTLSPGTYYWQAVYSGDSSNFGSTSTCGSEVETVTGGTGTPQPVSVTTVLSGGGQSAQQIVVAPGSAVSDQATLSGTNIATAGGTLTYNVYSDPGCTIPAGPSSTVNVVNGVASGPSAALTLPEGTYFWQASYSGDANNLAQLSTCGWETEVVRSSARTGADIGVELNAYPSSTVTAGTTPVLCFTVTNYGPKAAKNVIAGMLLPKGLSLVNSGGASQIGRLLIWHGGTFAIGQTVTYQVWVTPTGSGSPMVDAGALSIGTPDPNYHNNFTSDELTVAAGTRHLALRRVRGNEGVMLARLRVAYRALRHETR